MFQSLKLKVKTEISGKHFYEKATIMVIKKHVKSFICKKVYIMRLSAKIGFLEGPNGTYKQGNKLKEETNMDSVKF